MQNNKSFQLKSVLSRLSLRIDKSYQYCSMFYLSCFCHSLCTLHRCPFSSFYDFPASALYSTHTFCAIPRNSFINLRQTKWNHRLLLKLWFLFTFELFSGRVQRGWLMKFYFVCSKSKKINNRSEKWAVPCKERDGWTLTSSSSSSRSMRWRI